MKCIERYRERSVFLSDIELEICKFINLPSSGCLSLQSGKTGSRVDPQVFYSCCRWTVYAD